MWSCFALAPFAVALLLAGMAPDVRVVPDRQQSAVGQRRLESEALRRGGIRTAAALTGHYVGTVSAEPENGVESVEQLVAWHSLIVIGRVQSNRGWLTADGNTVVTDYVIAVDRVLKGDAAQLITVSMPGGRVTFENGNTATLTSTMRAPLNGERYLLFLRPSWFSATDRQKQAAGGPIYAPQHLSLSVYYLDPDKGVIPGARPGHPLQKELSGRDEADVVRAVARLTGARQAFVAFQPVRAFAINEVARRSRGTPTVRDRSRP